MKYYIAPAGYGESVKAKVDPDCPVLELIPYKPLMAQLSVIPNGCEIMASVPETWEELEKHNFAIKINEAMLSLEVTRNTLNRFHLQWEDNAFWNHDIILKAKPVDCLKAISTKAMICGNGPSLNIDGFDGEIFACWHAANRLDRVDYIAHCDANPIVTPSTIQPTLGLIATPNCSPKLFEAFNVSNSRVYAYLNRDLPCSVRFAEKMGCYDHNPIVGNVVDMMVLSAIYADYEEIYLSGVDLCFPTLEEAEAYQPGSEINEALNNKGEKVYTYTIYDIYRRGLEALPERYPHIKFFNTSENGLEINGYALRRA